MRHTMICFGDSNTYGFDPRSFLGGRYEAHSRWCDLLQEKTGWTIINEGENGRTLPRMQWEYQELGRVLQSHGIVNVVAVMLGTNDVLMDPAAATEKIARRMEMLLDFIQTNFPHLQIILLAPPPVKIPEPELCDRVKNLGKAYQQIAQSRELLFADTNEWSLELAYDGVHLSEKGHHIFAEKMEQILLSDEFPLTR